MVIYVSWMLRLKKMRPNQVGDVSFNMVLNYFTFHPTSHITLTLISGYKTVVCTLIEDLYKYSIGSNKNQCDTMLFQRLLLSIRRLGVFAF